MHIQVRRTKNMKIRGKWALMEPKGPMVTVLINAPTSCLDNTPRAKSKWAGNIR